MVAHTFYEGCNLTGSHEFALALGGADNNGHVSFAGRGHYRFQQHQIGDVEVN
jgi:hypothetical protein